METVPTIGVIPWEECARTPPSLRVVPQGEHEHWLCSASEERLIKSMELGRTILVNGHLLLKFEGRLAALCLEDFTGPDGSKFTKGVWYTPYGRDSREFYKDAYHGGATKISGRSDGDWAWNREAQATYVRNEKGEYKQVSKEKLLEMAKAYAGGVTGETLSPEEAEKRWQETYAENY